MGNGESEFSHAVRITAAAASSTGGSSTTSGTSTRCRQHEPAVDRRGIISEWQARMARA